MDPAPTCPAEEERSPDPIVFGQLRNGCGRSSRDFSATDFRRKKFTDSSRRNCSIPLRVNESSEANKMESDVIETHDLTKRYGKFEAVSQLNLRVGAGRITGFLG